MNEKVYELVEIITDLQKTIDKACSKMEELSLNSYEHDFKTAHQWKAWLMSGGNLDEGNE